MGKALAAYSVSSAYLALKVPAVAFGMMVFFVACATPPKSPPVPELTYDHDIAPIIELRCQPCHRQGGPGPMPLITFDDVMHNIVQIRGNVTDKVMPPERVDPATGEKHPAGLPNEEIALIVKWMQSGYRQR